MNFQEAEKTYKELKAQHEAGKLSDAAFEAEVGKLRLQDEQGRWWQIGVQTGEWYVHDGQKWNKAKPPVPAVSTPPPAPLVEKPVAPAPKPAEEKKETPKPEPAKGGPSLPARLFSSKPAGREGLSRPMLIGIIAGAAVLVLLLLLGGFWVVNNFLGIASAPTATPTRLVVVVPSPVASPTLRPTNTPLPASPTPVITATVPLTIPTATRTRAPVQPTATRVPGTPVPPSPTVPAVPPGVYATKLETIPAKPNIGDTLGFKVTFLNTTGAMQNYTVIVKVYQCPEQCEEFKHSYGETLRTPFNLAPGTSSITTSQNINLGIGIRCDLVAIPHYVDPTNQQVVPFRAINGNALYQAIKLCP